MKETRINSVASEPQRALLGYISAAQEQIRVAEEELLTKVSKFRKLMQICFEIEHELNLIKLLILGSNS